MNRFYRVFLVCLGVFCLSCFGATAKPLKNNLVVKKINNNRPQVQSTQYKSDFSPITRKSVSFPSKYSAGTIVIRTGERRLYHVTSAGRATAYGIGVGRSGFTWSGSNRISRKAEWPGWTPPARMRAREAKKGRILPAYMPGGPNNPLGARALYIGSTIYRIHGTNQPWTIGRAMSSGCIRMANDDVKHLYAKVGIGTRVVVLR
ncbi:L,D-transpeptidase family protein [Phyllobacterium sp. K27]